MTAPLLTKTWNVSANLRRAYSSLNDLAAWMMYQNKAAMVAAGWTVKLSCDGTTGPTNGADTTDRWASQANATTRAMIAGAAQSWIVLQNSDGVQVLITYQGASDDIWHLTFSPSGVYTLAGTTTFQPTATDEVVLNTANTMTNATASLDRVMTIWCTTDTKQWSFALFRNSTIVGIYGVERVNNLCAAGVFSSDGITDHPYVGYRYTACARTGTTGTGPVSGALNVSPGGASWSGGSARVFTGGAARITRTGGGEIMICPATGSSMSTIGVFNADKPAAQNALSSPMLPIYWSGEKVANLDGIIGYPIDWWQMYTSSGSTPGLGDFVPGYEPGDNTAGAARANWLVALGAAMVRPWKNASASLEIV